MKRINGIIITVFLSFILIFLPVNIYLIRNDNWQSGGEYKVSINRIKNAVEKYEGEKGKAPDDLDMLTKYYGEDEFQYITGLYSIKKDGIGGEEFLGFLEEGESGYIIFATTHNYYKVDYIISGMGTKFFLLIINVTGILFLIVMLSVLLYVRNKILKPFKKLSDVPFELSKGNLVLPLQENKSRVFGRFVWGMDLLRECLEENKANQLELQREKKMLLLSLFHDIKTPLSAINLYAKALSRNLYQDEDRRKQVIENISDKVDEIEGYISEIVRASNEDFLHFDVSNGEVYIGNVIEEIREYYTEKMHLNQIVFEIGDYRNCLVFGDGDRLVEVLQNIIENAIKYGDGGRIWIEFERDGEELVVCVCNTGCYLEAKEVNHIFDSFFRGSNVGEKPGSGLGLYICRSLMHQMEGEISAYVKEGNVMEVKAAVHLV